MHDVLIIGGGLAGLTSALHLANAGLSVGVLEKKRFPFHKFCGEYLSREVVPYLERLGVEMDQLAPRDIRRILFTAPSGKQIETPLPLGGISMTRFRLDQFLYQLAQKKGVKIYEGFPVEQFHFEEDHFNIKGRNGQIFRSHMLVGSYGKRSILDKHLQRPFFFKRSPYIGVKYYVEYEFPPDAVALFNFPGGYCGGIQVEDNLANFTYMIRKQSLDRYGKLPEMEAALVTTNPRLSPVFEQIRMQKVKPIVISNISFQPKQLIVDHALMCGDAAGMIAPVSGNGMAMAIHSAKLVSESIFTYFQDQCSREEMERLYQQKWQQLFGSRLFWGRQLQKFMGKALISELAVAGLRLIPGVFPSIIRQTHGTPIH
ncbi:MAG: NAD(P)/FAD-dependent oxidoreductase [Bacteroidota bacterium]